VTFFALAAYLTIDSIRDLATQAQPRQSIPGLAVTAAALCWLLRPDLPPGLWSSLCGVDQRPAHVDDVAHAEEAGVASDRQVTDMPGRRCDSATR
jgi:hypothetical protein